MTTYAEKTYPSLVPISIAVPPAAIVTALLVLVMHALIATEEPQLVEDPPKVAQLVPQEPEPLTLTEKEPPIKPDDALPPPQWIQPQASLTPEDAEITWANPTPIPGGDKVIDIHTGGGGIVAYLKPQPMYPSRAITRGIEGYVDLSFDITAAGATANIRVIESQPAGIFDKAAIKALQKWKYKVPVIDGVAEGQADMMTRMTFELDD